MKLSDLIEYLNKILADYGDGKVETATKTSGAYYALWIAHGWVFLEPARDEFKFPTVQIKFKPQGSEKGGAE